MNSLQVLTISTDVGLVFLILLVVFGGPFVMFVALPAWARTLSRRSELASAILEVDGRKILFHYRKKGNTTRSIYSHAFSDDDRISISFEAEFPSYQMRGDKASERSGVPATLELEEMEIPFFMSKVKAVGPGPKGVPRWVSFTYEGGFLHSRYDNDMLFGYISAEIVDQGSKSYWQKLSG